MSLHVKISESFAAIQILLKCVGTWVFVSDRSESNPQLEQRKMKLARLLRKDQEQYEKELKALRENGAKDRILRMKQKSENLKSARESARKQLADEKLFEHWRQNCPELRVAAQEQHKKHVIKGWSQQVEDKKAIKEKMKSQNRQNQKNIDIVLYPIITFCVSVRFEEEYERDRQRGLQEENEIANKRRLEEVRAAEALDMQIRELRTKEEESKRIKQEQDQLMQEQWNLQKMEEERKEIQKRRKKTEHGRFLARQYRAQMKRRCQQIQEDLEKDIQFLNALIAKEEEQQILQTERREKAQADAAWMKQVMEEQMRLEKAREAEMEMLYREEAGRMWQKREEEWEKERLARERLMAEVLSERQKQVREKMEIIKQQQQNAFEEREKLLQQLEFHNALTAREQEQQDKLKATRMYEIQNQITSRKEKLKVDKQSKLNELNDDIMAEQEYKEVLRDEVERMAIADESGLQQTFRRRKTAWE
ncbi:uncharacterized protein TRIADDRAFT_59089 [Trichoplax adhaerens]|uniref:Trichoplein keratin filament-binding protein n=1 Tax=Trichoplax adhaerens TaxID=10228 RepID=B3S4H7_TRIAD|nr:hypothetical protein TRIADDRAFT_59089 [Trichoplax adhaerens]EDV22467.1 hypothetical protein TRIADDRAFT_59089 [Trichoplax adhaerens]|eukprot:XP_002115011.1 hypothetical protein TRIADDRAFT_59089 [Trichoplax adhaerens]